MPVESDSRKCFGKTWMPILHHDGQTCRIHFIAPSHRIIIAYDNNFDMFFCITQSAWGSDVTCSALQELVKTAKAKLEWGGKRGICSLCGDRALIFQHFRQAHLDFTSKQCDFHSLTFSPRETHCVISSCMQLFPHQNTRSVCQPSQTHTNNHIKHIQLWEHVSAGRCCEHGWIQEPKFYDDIVVLNTCSEMHVLCIFNRKIY